MNRKRKALGLGLVAAMAMSALLVANAGATRSGHFTSDSPSGETTIVGHESAVPDFSHKLELASKGMEGIAKPTFCRFATYHGLIKVLTTEEIRVTPTFKECETTPVGGKLVTVHHNKCDLKFTSRTEPGDATAGLVCPVGSPGIQLTSHNGCVQTYGPQTVANAVTYDTTTENGKHAITVTVTATGIKFTAHGGPCVFLPTNLSDGTLLGSVTGTGIDPATNKPVNITAT